MLTIGGYSHAVFEMRHKTFRFLPGSRAALSKGVLLHQVVLVESDLRIQTAGRLVHGPGVVVVRIRRVVVLTVLHPVQGQQMVVELPQIAGSFFESRLESFDCSRGVADTILFYNQCNVLT